MKKITMDGKYTYRSGEPARILCVDGPGDYPVKTLSDKGRVHHHFDDGKVYGVSDFDLIPVSNKRVETWYQGLDEHGAFSNFFKKKEAKRVHCYTHWREVRIEFDDDNKTWRVLD